MDKTIYSTTRRGFLKTVAVGAGGYTFGSLLIKPKEAMGQSLQSYLEKVPMEVRWNIVAGGLVNTQISNFQALLHKEGREKFTEIVKKRGITSGGRNLRLTKKFGFTGNDAKSVAAMSTALITMYYGPKQKYETEESTAEKASLKCINCSFWNAVQARKITDNICSTWSQYWWEGFAKAVNPKLTVNLVKARPLGDSVCEWVIELKA